MSGRVGDRLLGFMRRRLALSAFTLGPQVVDHALNVFAGGAGVDPGIEAAQLVDDIRDQRTVGNPFHRLQF